MWSLGCILYEMLVGSAVFFGENQAQVLMNVQRKQVVFPEHIKVSEELIGLLQQVIQSKFFEFLNFWCI
jgi:hypothetical protein